MPTLRFSQLEIDTERRELRREGATVEVQPRILHLICHLAANHGHAVSREELVRAVWDGVHVSPAAVDRAVSAARRLLGDDGRRQEVIRTQRGRGYCWLPVPDTARPERATHGGDPGFVGRDRELAASEGLLHEALAGRGGLVLVSGEPGIGKTRLAAALAERGRRRGAAVAVGRCPEAEGAPPYWPWTQILRDVLPADASRRRVLAGRSAAVLRQAMPELEPLLPEADDAAPAEPLSGRPARLRLYEHLRSAWRELTDERPLVLLFDDLHCADEDSRDLLTLLAADVASLPLLLVATFREAQLPSDSTLSARIGELARSERSLALPLRGLESGEIAALARTLTGREPDAGQVDALRERTGGNPFFLTQLLRGDAETTAPGLAAALRGHLRIVSPSTRSRLAAAAVVGRRFSLPVLAAALGEPPAKVATALEEARAAGLVEAPHSGGARFAFIHALIAEQLVSDLSSEERCAHHAAIARAVLQVGGENARGEAAHHAVRALPEGSAEEAFALCLASAEDACARLAWGEARRRLAEAREVLDWLPDAPRRRLDLALRTGEVELRRGELERAREHFEEAAGRAREAGDAEAFARAAVGHAGELDDARTEERSIALLEEAVALAGDARGVWAARVRGRLAEALYHGEASLERAGRLGAEALALARELDDEALLCEALRMRLWSGYTPDNPDERESLSAELLRRARAQSRTVDEHEALTYRIAAALERGDRDTLDGELDAYRGLRRRAGHPILDFYGGHYDAMRALLDAEVERAEALLFAAFERGGRTGYPVAITWFAIQLWGVRREQDRLGELEDSMREMAREYPVTPWRFALAVQQVRARDDDVGHAALADLEALGIAHVRRDLSWAALLWYAAELCARLGARETGAAVHRALLPFAGRHAQVGLGMLHLGSIDHALGRASLAMGAVERAEAHFARAVEVEARLRARPAVLRSRLAQAGVALARGGDPATAERVAALAREAHGLGLRAIATEAEALRAG